MEQHPIPQQISSYQFKLVGDMTLKQFFQVAGGVIVSLIFYSVPFHPLIKWPLVIFFTLLGIALAFLPFEERPLERWILAFFRSIYSPTLYSWEKTNKPPVFYTESAVVPEIKTDLITNPVVEVNTKKLEDDEKTFLSKLGNLWNITNSVPPVKQVVTPPVVGSTVAMSTPQQIPTVITSSAPKLVVQETDTHKTGAEAVTTHNVSVPVFDEKPMTTNLAKFSIDAAPPSPTIAINTIVGQVMDMDRKIIEGAILEIKDSSGRPVRALKSNNAGHFITVTPLSNGKYEVTTEKDGFTFEPISFDAKGEMIPAIAIKGTKLE